MELLAAADHASWRYAPFGVRLRYRIISRLNCLNKVSGKIPARRLAYLTELLESKLLYHD